MARVRTNFVSGTLVNSLNSSTTVLQSTNFSRLDNVDSPDVALVVLDPFGVHGVPELVTVTAHPHSGNSDLVLVTRGSGGSVARSHPEGTQWTHAPVNTDFSNIEEYIRALAADPTSDDILVTDLPGLPTTGLAYDDPVTLHPDAGTSAGTSTAVARSDHRHDTPTDVAVGSAPGDAAAEGVSTSFARADHVHSRESVAELIRLVIPTGTVLPYAGSSAPSSDFLLCDGSLLLRASYPALFTAIGTTFDGTVDGTHFRLPDLQGKFPLGVSGGHARGATGGAETVTLDSSQIPGHTHTGPSHTHSVNSHTHSLSPHTHGKGNFRTQPNTHTHGLPGFGAVGLLYSGTYGLPPGYGLETIVPGVTNSNTHFHELDTFGSDSQPAQTSYNTDTGLVGGTPIPANTGGTSASTAAAGTGATGSTGGGSSHPNMPPFISLNYIIKVT